MKIAVTATGTDLQATIDPRFGRARYILLVEVPSLAIEVLDNSENVQAFKGAGIQAATRVAGKGVAALLTGFCGPNAFRTLEAGGVQVVQDVNGTVREAVKSYSEGRLQKSAAPNREGHW